MNKQQVIINDLEIFLSNGRVSALSVLKMLSEHGVAIKKEGELPTNNADVPFRPMTTDINAVQVLCGMSNLYGAAQKDMLKAGYTQWEPLI